MTFDEYQEACRATAIYPKELESEYLAMGLISEIGELAGKIKKQIRDDVNLTKQIHDEAGDICWYSAMLCNSKSVSMGHMVEASRDWFTGFQYSWNRIAKMTKCAGDMLAKLKEPNFTHLQDVLFELRHLLHLHGTTLEAVCEANIAKLQSRQERGKLGGSGDNR